MCFIFDCVLLPSSHHEAQAHHDLQRRGERRGQSDVEQGHGHPAAHQIGHGHADAEGADDALEHHEAGHADAVVEADEAEEDGGEQAVDAVGLQVVRGGDDDLAVLGEHARQQLAVEEGQ